MSNKLNISSPWIEYYRKVNAIFGEDPDVTIKFDSVKHVLKMYVKGQEKADAIGKIMPSKVEFGTVTVTIEVIPDNGENDAIVDIFQKAFDGNPAISYIKAVGKGLFKVNYVVFENKVVQYYNDDLGDVNGLESTLYENIARDIFDKDLNVFYCTDVENKELEKPLGEWP